VRGSFAALRALLPLLRESPRFGGAVVVNISSIAARTAMGSNVMYCASKAALDSMTQSLARALAPSIRVLSVSPGLVDTDFVQSLDPQWRDEQAARTPLGRLAARRRWRRLCWWQSATSLSPRAAYWRWTEAGR